MSLLKNLQLWWTTDPKAKAKTWFILGVVVFFVLLLYFIWWINFGDSSTGQNSANLDLNSTSNLSFVDPKSFEDSTRLEPVTKNPTSYPHLFARLENKIYNFSSNGKLMENSQELADSPVFIPFSLYATTEGVIINALDGVTIYQNGQWQKLSNNIIHVYPELRESDTVSGSKSVNRYLFLTVVGETYTLGEASNLLLNRNVRFFSSAEIDPNPKIVEIRVIDRQVYLFTYSNYQKQGNIQIWHLDAQNQLKLFFLLRNIQSLQIGSQYLLYTKSTSQDLAEVAYDNFLWNLKEDPKILNNLQAQLLQENIAGNLWAGRCVFDSNSNFYCLIKENKTWIVAKKEADAIFKYNWQTQELTFPIKGIKISGSNLLIDNEQLFLVGQENGIVYKILMG